MAQTPVATKPHTHMGGDTTAGALQCSLARCRSESQVQPKEERHISHGACNLCVSHKALRGSHTRITLLQVPCNRF